MKIIRTLGIALLLASTALTFFGVSGGLPVWTIIAGGLSIMIAVVMIWPKQLYWLIDEVLLSAF